MSNVVIRIPAETHASLLRIAEERQETIGHVVTDLINDFEEQRFWAEFRESVARLKVDPETWREFQEEQRIYDGTLMDGLEPETWPNE